MAKAIAAVRKIDKKTPIIVEADCYSNPEMIEYLPIFPYPDVYYSLHFYLPFDLTHQLNVKKKHFRGYPDAKANQQFMRNVLANVRKFQEKTGARIYVGECGGNRWVPGIHNYYRDLLSLFEEYGWSWTFHAFRESDAFDTEIGSTKPVRIWGEKKRAAARVSSNPRIDTVKYFLAKNKENK
jgi:hypothetical protein